MPHIDLNCDLGESFGAYTIGMDEKVIPFITSANVACGFHAGDPLVMQRTVALCKQSGAAVGAHPGFPDLQGFGRRQMKLTPAEAKACVQYQIGALKAFCDAAGVPLHHVKPHGALYNMGGRERAGAGAFGAGGEGLCRGLAPGPVALAAVASLVGRQIQGGTASHGYGHLEGTALAGLCEVGQYGAVGRAVAVVHVLEPVHGVGAQDDVAVARLCGVGTNARQTAVAPGESPSASDGCVSSARPIVPRWWWLPA